LSRVQIALLISGIGISPFLATSARFSSAEHTADADDGGNPVYLPPNGVPKAFRFSRPGTIGGNFRCRLRSPCHHRGGSNLLARSRFGRVVLRGDTAGVVRYSGIAIRSHVAITFVIAGIIAAAAGLILTATVNCLYSLLRQRLSAQRHRRHLHRHDA